MIAILDIEPERLHHRVTFLRSRAMAHLEASPGDMRHKACAATLLRDAACVALLLGETGKGRRYLREAGDHFLGLGLTVGSALTALADTRKASDKLDNYSDVVEGIRHQRSREEVHQREGPERPMADRAQGSLRQMFSQLQAELLVSEPDELPSLRIVPMHQVLTRNGGYPVGDTGLSISSYMKIAEWMIEQRSARDRQIPGFVTAGLTTLASTRAEHIRAAMEDRFHWRMLAKPAELLDLDSVILMFLALGARMDKDALQASLSAGEVPINKAPLTVAQELRDDQELSSDGAFEGRS